MEEQCCEYPVLLFCTQASGFCYVNDIVIAILELLKLVPFLLPLPTSIPPSLSLSPSLSPSFPPSLSLFPSLFPSLSPYPPLIMTLCL